MIARYKMATAMLLDIMKLVLSDLNDFEPMNAEVRIAEREFIEKHGWRKYQDFLYEIGWITK